MSKLNPLYFVLFFFIVMLSSIFSINFLKNSLKNERANYKHIEKIGNTYNNLNSKWDNITFVNNKINEIVNNSIYKNEKILKISSNDSIMLSIESKKNGQLNRFFNEIINNEFIIKELKLGDKSIEFKIGVIK